MTLILFDSCPQKRLMQADWMVIPLSLSWGKKSVTVDPESTEPGPVRMAAERERKFSVTVVFPASTWAKIPTFRIKDSRDGGGAFELSDEEEEEKSLVKWGVYKAGRRR